jgi:hypothetical protein
MLTPVVLIYRCGGEEINTHGEGPLFTNKSISRRVGTIITEIIFTLPKRQFVRLSREILLYLAQDRGASSV